MDDINTKKPSDISSQPSDNTEEVNAAQNTSEATEVTEATNVTEASADSENPFAALKEDNEAGSMNQEASEEKTEEITAPETVEAIGNEEAKVDSAVSPSTEPVEEVAQAEEAESGSMKQEAGEESAAAEQTETTPEETPSNDEEVKPEPPVNPKARWYVVHTFAGHENKVATALRQRIEAEHLENLIFDILVPTQDKIEIKGGKKETVKEKIFPGYILIKMELNDNSWLAVRTTQGVTSFIGAGNKPTPISEAEVASIVRFTSQGAQPTFKDVFMIDDTVKIIDGPFAEFIGKVDSVDKEKGRVRVLVSIFGRETPVELDFLQVQKL